MALPTGSTAQVQFGSGINCVKSLGGALSNPTIPANFPSFNQTLQLGVGLNQFNFGYIGSRSVTAASPETIDLTSTLIALDGTTCAFSDILLLAIAVPTGGGNLLVGNAASNAWSAALGATGVLTVNAGTTAVISTFQAAGYTVDSTHKNLKIDASAGTITYTLMVLGH